MQPKVYYIKANRFLLEDEERQGGFLKVEHGLFGDFINEAPPSATIIDWTGYTIAPGLFDTHIHGVNGYDIMDGTAEAVDTISKAILPFGVTRFLPTTLTASDEGIVKAIHAITEAVDKGLSGAKSEGIFLEGPYFTEKYKGAQNPIYFKNPSVTEFNEWQKLAKGTIVKIAIAPERENAIEFIREIGRDVVVGIAHTDASFECCKEAVDAGARKFIHLFNGMSGLHHREPGVVGAALVDSRAYAELICDGFHVHPEVATMALKLKKDKLVLITDCMRAGLMPDGNYLLGEFPVVMKDGIAKTESGSLAGSTLTLIEGVLNLQAWSQEPLYRVWHRGSLSPAASIGKADQFGSIEKGKVADYVVLYSELTVRAVAVEGVLKYERDL